LGEHNAILKVLTASICGTDLRTYRFGSDMIRPPRIIGHEVCGIIQQIGPSVEGFQEGDRVVVAPAIGCGVCPPCRKGITNMCDNLQTLGFEYDGAFAEYMEIPAQAFRMGNVLKVGKEVPAEQASLAEPVACCVNGQRFLNIRPEDFVTIFGAGFIGCIHAELAIRSGASRVVVADVSDGRLAFAEKTIGRIDPINPAREDIVRYVRDRTAGRGADVVITANPDGRIHATATEIATKRGRISLFGGVPKGGTGYLDSNAIHYKELAVYGSHATTPQRVREVLEWLANDELRLGKYVSGEYPLERILEAFESFRNENVMKLIARP
jgi:L-iditol 2-dehydrogenase